MSRVKIRLNERENSSANSVEEHILRDLKISFTTPAASNSSKRPLFPPQLYPTPVLNNKMIENVSLHYSTSPDSEYSSDEDDDDEDEKEVLKNRLARIYVRKEIGVMLDRIQDIQNGLDEVRRNLHDLHGELSLKNKEGSS